jgi:hypothetical protein
MNIAERLELFWAAPMEARFDQVTVSLVLDISAASLERARWACEGLPYAKFGRHVTYRKADVVAALQRGTITPRRPLVEALGGSE